jgi:hypothetical protein
LQASAVPVIHKGRFNFPEVFPMFNDFMDKVSEGLDRCAAFAWELFEKDLALTESILQRTESIFATVESKLPTSVRRFFGDSSDS